MSTCCPRLCCYQVSGSLARHEEDFSAQHDKDATVLSCANTMLSSVDDADQRCLLFQSDIEQCLLCSVRCYENAQTYAQTSKLKLQKELGTCQGSVWNEVGLYYMQLSETFNVHTGQCICTVLAHQFLCIVKETSCAYYGGQISIIFAFLMFCTALYAAVCQMVL